MVPSKSLCWLAFVNLTQSTLTWKVKILIERMPLSDWPADKSDVDGTPGGGGPGDIKK